MDKKTLREKYLNIRKNIDSKSLKSKKICDKIQDLDIYLNSKIIACYKSLSQEVDTSYLIKDAIRRGKTVLLPRVNGDNLDFYKVSNLETIDLEKSKFGVEEPKEIEENYVSPEMIDLIIVPGLCFDKTGNRLGFGKGFYDRFLSGIEAFSIGICFIEQLVDEKMIPTNDNDKKVNLVICDD